MCYLFAGDTVIEGTRNEFMPILNQKTTYYIVDCYEARIILLAPPDPSIWSTSSVQLCTVCYMPLWTDDEIDSCHAKLYGDLPQDIVSTNGVVFQDMICNMLKLITIRIGMKQ
ncbi:hypothetical protein THRCLA_23282 [Thraustotheca clavata]|uniref:Uncharacterized protein n=1 Tax=Thraustotheca clavata TaxID=74557 RepID=A0A1V9Y886_9STRA|nr:hypothetical protein THRCLA_23282 [Thraustotheca clavata]